MRVVKPFIAYNALCGGQKLGTIELRRPAGSSSTPSESLARCRPALDATDPFAEPSVQYRSSSHNVSYETIGGNWFSAKPRTLGAAKR